MREAEGCSKIRRPDPRTGETESGRSRLVFSEHSRPVPMRPLLALTVCLVLAAPASAQAEAFFPLGLGDLRVYALARTTASQQGGTQTTTLGSSSWTVARAAADGQIALLQFTPDFGVGTTCGVNVDRTNPYRVRYTLVESEVAPCSHDFSPVPDRYPRGVVAPASPPRSRAAKFWTHDSTRSFIQRHPRVRGTRVPEDGAANDDGVGASR